MTTMTAVRSAVRYVSQVKYSCARLVVFGKILLKNVTRSRYDILNPKVPIGTMGMRFNPANPINWWGRVR